MHVWRRGLVLLSVLGGVLAACTSNAALPSTTHQVDVATGQAKFAATCANCHGEDATGIPGLGKNLTTSSFVKSKTDNELAAFISQGRTVTDPLNTTKVAMPPRGGSPTLTDADLSAIVTYIRTLQK
jgi:mono/diheme cytochrome c family protein